MVFPVKRLKQYTVLRIVVQGYSGNLLPVTAGCMLVIHHIKAGFHSYHHGYVPVTLLYMPANGT